MEWVQSMLEGVSVFINFSLWHCAIVKFLPWNRHETFWMMEILVVWWISTHVNIKTRIRICRPSKPNTRIFKKIYMKKNTLEYSTHSISSWVHFLSVAEQSLRQLPVDMSTARQHLKSPSSLSGTSAHPTMVTLVNIMPPHSWDLAISDSGLETPRSRSWVWSRGNVVQSAQCHINSLLFHFTSIRPTIPEIQLFRNLTLKHPRSRSWVRSKVKVTYYTQYQTDALPFRFTSMTIRPIIPEIWPK